VPLSTFRRDVRVAWRILRRQRLYLAITVASLGVAIAVNTTIYSMLDAMMHPRIAGAHPERLYTLRYYGDVRHVLPANAIPSALTTGLHSYEAVSGYHAVPGSITAVHGGLVVDGQLTHVRDDFFSVVAVPAVDGRLAPLQKGDGVPSIVISDRLRGTLFPGGASAVGAVLVVDGRRARVIGVARRYVAFDGLDADVWMFDVAGEKETRVNLLRLRERSSPGALQNELNTVSARLAFAAGESPRDSRFFFKPITRQFQVGGLHYALIAVAAAILLVACANLSNLQLARGLDRARELAVRASLGGSRGDLIRMLLTETGVLACGGLILGLVLSGWSTIALHSVVPPETAGYATSPEASLQMVVFAAAIAVLCVVLIGLLPAIRLSDVHLDTLIKSGTGTGAHRAQRVRYGVLVVAQIGLTLPLVIGAMLLAKGDWQYENPSYRMTRLFGFNPDSVIVARVQVRAPKDSYVKVAPIAAALVSRALSLRNVGDAGIIIAAFPPGAAITVAGRSGSSTEFPAPLWPFRLVSPGYFRAAGRPIEKGSQFIDGGSPTSSVIVDRATAVYLWPGQNPIGESVKLGGARSTEPWLPVVGVLGDHLDAAARAQRAWFDTLRLSGVYKSISESDSALAGRRGMPVQLWVRPIGPPLMAVAQLREALNGMNLADVPVVFWGRDEWAVSRTIIQRRFMTSLFSGAAGICLALAVLGVYGIVAQSVAQRRREFAVRISLGASPRSILALILSEGNVFALSGTLIGLVTANETCGWLGSLVGDPDASTAAYVAVGTVAVFLIAAFAALGPAANAARIDPAEALRAE
jgi:putative ABC transport system permease protein